MDELLSPPQVVATEASEYLEEGYRSRRAAEQVFFSSEPSNGPARSSVQSLALDQSASSNSIKRFTYRTHPAILANLPSCAEQHQWRPRPEKPPPPPPSGDQPSPSKLSRHYYNSTTLLEEDLLLEQELEKLCDEHLDENDKINLSFYLNEFETDSCDLSELLTFLMKNLLIKLPNLMIKHKLLAYIKRLYVEPKMLLPNDGEMMSLMRGQNNSCSNQQQQQAAQRQLDLRLFEATTRHYLLACNALMTGHAYPSQFTDQCDPGVQRKRRRQRRAAELRRIQQLLLAPGSYPIGVESRSSLIPCIEGTIRQHTHSLGSPADDTLEQFDRCSVSGYPTSKLRSIPSVGGAPLRGWVGSESDLTRPSVRANLNFASSSWDAPDESTFQSVEQNNNNNNNRWPHQTSWIGSSKATNEAQSNHHLIRSSQSSWSAGGPAFYGSSPLLDPVFGSTRLQASNNNGHLQEYQQAQVCSQVFAAPTSGNQCYSAERGYPAQEPTPPISTRSLEVEWPGSAQLGYPSRCCSLPSESWQAHSSRTAYSMPSQSPYQYQHWPVLVSPSGPLAGPQYGGRDLSSPRSTRTGQNQQQQQQQQPQQQRSSSSQPCLGHFQSTSAAAAAGGGFNTDINGSNWTQQPQHYSFPSTSTFNGCCDENVELASHWRRRHRRHPQGNNRCQWQEKRHHQQQQIVRDQRESQASSAQTGAGYNANWIQLKAYKQRQASNPHGSQECDDASYGADEIEVDAGCEQELVCKQLAQLPVSVAEQMKEQASKFVHAGKSGQQQQNRRSAGHRSSGGGRKPNLQVRRTLRVKIKKSKPILGIAIEGGFNVSGQLLPRIVCVHEEGAAYQCGKLRASDLILEVNGHSTVNMNHDEIANTISKAYYQDPRPYIEFLIGESIHVST